MHGMTYAMAVYTGWARWAEIQVGVDKFLHVCAGLAFWLLAAALTRRPLTDLRTLIPLLLLETANELVDFVYHYKWSLSDTIGDIWWTFFWPLVLIAFLRRRGLGG